MSLSSTALQPQRKIRCLVIQLARMGDTLQSLMALRAAKQLYPDLEIHFVVRERFSAAAKRVPWIENVITLPTDALLGPVLRGNKSELQALGDVARWIAPLIKDSWDFVVNWSYSEASSFLTGLIPGKVKLGYSRRKDTSFSSGDGWSNYIQAVVQGGTGQNIHLTDILTTQLLTALQIHVGEPANDGNAPVTSKTFFTLELGEREQSPLGDLSRKWLAIQLGAGRDDKTWDAANWSRLAGSILKRHPEYNIVLLGGKEDAVRARRFLSELRSEDLDERRVISLVGETGFDLWASVVGRCQWLLAGDTAAIHLASVLGTRVLNISIGPVRWSETGPYGNGHYVVAPAAGAASAVTPEAVYATWSYASSEWSHRRQFPIEEHFGHLGCRDHIPGVRVFRSRIRSTGDGGGVAYESLFTKTFDLSDWTGMVMGHLARSWYCGWVPPIGQELTRSMIDPRLVKDLRELDESSQVLLKVCEEARRTSIELHKKSGNLKSHKVMRLKDREELQGLAGKLTELEELMERLGRTHSPLLAFAQMSKVFMHNLSGNSLSELGKDSAECFKRLEEGVTILRQWLRFTLDLVKPVAIRSQGAPLELVRGPGGGLSP